MERFDSASLFSIFKNEGGENLLDFEELEGLLADPADPVEVPMITTESPFPLPAVPIKAEVPAVVPSTSGAGDSNHTRATTTTPGWGSNPSSDGGGDSGGSDADGNQQQDGSSGKSSRGRTGRNSSKAGVSKRRQRNADQMESNRVAQQKYRQRKKSEQGALQQAVDMLTAQVAALKAVEVRAAEVSAANAALHSQVAAQGSTIVALQQHSAAQASELTAVRGALGASQQQAAAQHALILDQQAKLRLQEQVIASLKDRLRDKIDEAMQNVVPGSVCEKMVAAVKATLYGAKDQHGLQEVLASLPEHLVLELCKNIFHVCKESWPELRLKCGQQVPPNAACHMAGAM